ncbi:helix-turn-helix transcriptional regulator [Calidifontibacter sp. DB0510]|uniref:Helix-turn-helix transcriptional regulator n=2 Tax=Metallococcus carri TaxID=1656884 RepID=A0A967B108_9MICO|nr:helix-turn-helix transcriptional regulator [Metallococcus carri]NOP37804.1 helix-turn-helix transcriptional regulator [Calidifontibacter sp. DB2511S]
MYASASASQAAYLLSKRESRSPTHLLHCRRACVSMMRNGRVCREAIAMLEGLERVAGPTTARDIESLAGNLLRRARKARGLDLSEVAAAAQVPVETVAAIEDGEVQPSLPELLLILISIGKELRIRIEDFDDHDKVLDERAARFPERQRAMEEHRDRLLDNVTEEPR